MTSAARDGGRLPGAVGGGGAARAWRRDRRGGVGAGRGGVPASDVAGRRSAAAHARPGREPRARPRRAVVGAGWPAAVCAGADGELRLPGGAARRADADARASSGRRCARGSPRWSACAGGCWSGSAGGGRRSRPRWQSAGRRARGRRRRRRSRPGSPKDRHAEPGRARRRVAGAGGRARLGPGRAGVDRRPGPVGRGRRGRLAARVPAARRRRTGSRIARRRSRARRSSRRSASSCRPAPRVDAAALEAAADRFLASSARSPLVPDERGCEGDQGFRRRDGRVLPVDRQQLRYSTPRAARARAAADRSRAATRAPATPALADAAPGRRRARGAADAVGRAARDGQAALPRR